MKPFFRTRYRIVRDTYLGYEAQVRKWWWPCYFQINGCNTRSTLEKSRLLVELHKDNTVYSEDIIDTLKDKSNRTADQLASKDKQLQDAFRTIKDLELMNYSK